MRASGKWGLCWVDDGTVNRIRNWRYSDELRAAVVVDSSTEIGTARRDGVYDFTGSFETFGHTPIVMPGDYFSLR